MSTQSIWNDFGERIFAFILSKVNDYEAARDIQQEVFLKIHTRLDTLKNETALSGWLFTITRNTVNDHFRSLKKKRKNEQELEAGAHLLEEEALPEFCQTCLHLFINELPIKYSEAILATDLGELSQKDYANQLGLSHSGVKSRVQRGRAQLNEYFKNCCLAKNEHGESNCLHKNEYACTCN